MTSKIGPEEGDFRIKFGGGLHTRTPEDEIGDRETAGGENFDLDVRNSDLRARAPFDLLGTAPNGSEIRGGGSFKDSDGNTHMFIQAGDTVYEWDGQNFNASPTLDTVNSNAELRGHWRSHYWALDDKLLITDLSLNEVVKEWDGTTWQDVSFTNEAGSGFGDFAAKYLEVNNERAVFSNISEVTLNPHLIVGSQRSDYTIITVENRPSSALSAQDPFFLISPDLRDINGHVSAFGTTLLSTEAGQLFNLTGSNATDFAFEDFFAGSGANGDESLAYIGNDVIYGRQGRIESVRDTERFGDSEAADLTTRVADEIEDFTGWRTIYNSRLNRVYLFPSNASEVWVFDTAMRGADISPWMRWRTQHSLAFQPSFVMSMLDPLDGLEYVFMGDDSGNLYRLEGTGTSGDAGTTNISMEWLTKLFSVPMNAELFDIQGYIKYRKLSQAAEVSLSFEYAGTRLFDQSLSVEIPATPADTHYSNEDYYSDGEYYGTSFLGRLSRKQIFPIGGSSEFQLRVTVNGTSDFALNEIGLRFRVAG